MKTPDEIKQNIIDCMDEAIVVNETGDAHDLLDFSDKAHVCMATALTHIQQLESNYSQVSKALCGKGNASLAEILGAITQVKAECDDARMNHAHVTRLLKNTVEMKERFKRLVVKAMKELGTVKRERDAAVRDCSEFPCNTCTENNPHFYSPFCKDCIKSGNSRRTNHEWRGVCPENTEVQNDAQTR